jgi:hypothetical protein
MDSGTHNFLIIGLPDAGKTSYIHAVDDLLQKPPNVTSLRSYGLAEDRTYLERDKADFRGGKKLLHTERNLQGPTPELWFEDPGNGIRGKLFLPDISGEVFQDQWVDRKWSKVYGTSLQGLSGILLFVRADLPASNQELLGEMAKLPSEERVILPWDARKASPQVQLVDVLQFIAERGPLQTKILKLCVLISAWDTVHHPGNIQPKNPTAFLKREWPLLDQYLKTNSNTFRTRIFGVSALGGTQQELDGELGDLPPQERVKLVYEDSESKDLTSPLQWLMNGEV